MGTDTIATKDKGATMPSPEVLLETRRFRVERVTQRMPDGKEHAREVVRHPGAVVILPLLDDGRHRAGAELPRRGRSHAGRTAGGHARPGRGRRQATARRELAEETGYRAGRIEPLVSFYMSPGILDERMHAFVARELTPGEMALDAGEQLEPFAVTWDEVRLMLERGEIEDGKTIAALLYYERFRDERERRLR